MTPARGTLQGTCLRLLRFWTDEGCLLLPAHDQPLIAGVLHPDVMLSLLTTSSRSLVALQPVRRPLDGRHGNQPYRLARHLQLVAVLRPAPDDLTRRFLASLRGLGLALEDHDLRFTEGRWSLPAIDAWGLGWNVRLDGLGVARVTVMQAVAGRALEPVAAEIAYGIERLSACAAGARSAYEVPWTAKGPAYAAVRRVDEDALSRHAFELADPASLRARLALDERESAVCLDAGALPLAYAAAVRRLYLLDLLAARRELSAVERRQAEAGVADTLAAVAEALSAEVDRKADDADAEGAGDGG